MVFALVFLCLSVCCLWSLCLFGFVCAGVVCVWFGLVGWFYVCWFIVYTCFDCFGFWCVLVLIVRVFCFCLTGCWFGSRLCMLVVVFVSNCVGCRCVGLLFLYLALCNVCGLCVLCLLVRSVCVALLVVCVGALAV